MEESKNKYSYPINLENVMEVTYKRSPAHAKTYKDGKHYHAIDFISPEKTELFAVLGGEVWAVKQKSNIGGKDESFDKHTNYIEIKHANGEYSYYEHIMQNGACVKVGDKVKKGQLIGYSGATGWLASLRPHLHFEVHKYFGPGDEDYKSIKIRWEEELPARLIKAK